MLRLISAPRDFDRQLELSGMLVDVCGPLTAAGQQYIEMTANCIVVQCGTLI